MDHIAKPLCPEEEPLKTAQPGIASLHALLQLYMLSVMP